MVSFFEVIKRALNGPYYTEKDFDLKVMVPKLRGVLKKYDIRYDPSDPISIDDQLADNVFQAGLELCVETGVYCTDTQRLIRFSREEILEALREAPSRQAFGEGRDRKVMVPRKPESEIPPWCFLGAGGATCSDGDVYVRLVEGYARIPLIDSITCPNLATINGALTQAGSPLEILACIQSVELARMGLRRAQRPGLPIMNSISTAVTDTGKITGSEFGLRNTDCWSIGFTAEFKIPFERLNEIAYVLARGGQIQGETCPILGGYAGGPAGTAVVTAAYHIFAILVLRASNQMNFCLGLQGWNTNQMLMWTQGLATQAITRNTHMPFIAYTHTAAGPMTEMNFYEIAAGVISSIASGGSIEVGQSGSSQNIDHQSPLQPMLASEVAHAAARLSRVEANGIVKELLAKYEDRLRNPPKGVSFQESYDWGSIEPKQEYADLYGRVKAELSSLGLEFA